MNWNHLRLILIIYFSQQKPQCLFKFEHSSKIFLNLCSCHEDFAYLNYGII